MELRTLDMENGSDVGGSMKSRLLLLFLALSLLGCGKLIRRALGDCRETGCSAGKECGPDGDGTVWKCYTPSPEKAE